MLIQAFTALPRSLRLGAVVVTAVFTAVLGWFVFEGTRAARIEIGASQLMNATRQYELAGNLASLHQELVVYAQQAALHPQTISADWRAWMHEHLKRLRVQARELHDIKRSDVENASTVTRQILDLAVQLEGHFDQIEARLKAPVTNGADDPEADNFVRHAAQALAIAELALQRSPQLQQLVELSRTQDRLEREALLRDRQQRYTRSTLAMGSMILLGYVALMALMVASIMAQLASSAKDDAMRERLASGEERAQAAQTKMQFLRMVSHELRTPLQTLYAASENLEGQLKGTYMEPTLRRMRSAVRQLQTQIGDLSEFARTSETGLRIQTHPTDIAELLKSVVAASEDSARTKGLRLSADIRALPALVQTDTARLWQILTNLMENAIKYTDRGEVMLGAGYATGSLIITVRDTGRGISPEAHAQVWEPFYRAVGNSADAPGSGLGLAIVKRLVSSLGGEIQMVSAPGVGTTFTLRVPAPEAQAEDTFFSENVWEETPLTAPGELTRPNSRTVLVVGGDQISRLSITRLLESLGETWVAEERADQALRHARQMSFDLVLIDLPSTGQEGLACAQALRRENLMPKGGRIVGITDIHTAPSKPPDGFDQLVSKPVRLVTLRQMLDN